MPTLPRFLYPVLSAALLALSLAATPQGALAQTTIQGAYPIGLDHASVEPYNFTGRVFDLDNIAFGSGTLIRRHTILTAGHVVFDPTNGFISNATFTRGLYEDYSFDKNQVVKVDALTGYTAAVASSGSNSSNEAFSRDMGYVLVMDAPRDGTWGVFQDDPTVLANTANQFFILGYPGEDGFDGRTMAYIVPSTTFTQIGTSVTSGLYENDGFVGIPGESGGPVYYYNGSRQIIVGEIIGGLDDSSGEFNFSYVRGITADANTFLTSAEYVNGLIKKIKIKGPKSVEPGKTVIYTATPQFLVPDSGTKDQATTDRYQEYHLKTSTPGTSTTPAVTIKSSAARSSR